MLPTQQEIMAANLRSNQAQSDVFPMQQQYSQNTGGSGGNPQYMDSKAKERMLQEQSQATFSQSDSNDGGTFARLSTDSRPANYLPGQFNPSHA